jgi:hypothetical protein
MPLAVPRPSRFLLAGSLLLGVAGLACEAWAEEPAVPGPPVLALPPSPEPTAGPVGGWLDAFDRAARLGGPIVGWLSSLVRAGGPPPPGEDPLLRCWSESAPVLLPVPVGPVALHAAPERHHVAARAFHIPFRVWGLGCESKELRLFVRSGSAWQLADVAGPDAGTFDFRAERDGEYEFAVQCVGRDGVARPSAADLAATLAVVVDTVPPTVRLGLGPDGPRWSVEGAATDGVRLEYRLTASDGWRGRNWTPVAPGDLTRPLPVPPGVTCRVRLTAADRAGNTAEATAEFSAPPAAVSADRR